MLDENGIGNYFLIVQFSERGATQETFAAGRLDATHSQDQYVLYVAQSHRFQFVLDVNAAHNGDQARVRMSLFDSRGRLLFALGSFAGDTASDSALLLTMGAYRIVFAIGEDSDDAHGPMEDLLRGVSLSDPIGVPLEDPTFEPMYVCGEDGDLYCYPGGVVSDQSLYWVRMDDQGSSESSSSERPSQAAPAPSPVESGRENEGMPLATDPTNRHGGTPSVRHQARP